MLVDPLLKLVEDQGAQGLVVRASAPPALDKRGQTTPLSMPSLDAETLAMVLEGVTTPDQRATVERGETIETEYKGGNGKRWTVLVDRPGGELRMLFRPVATGGAANARAEAKAAASAEPAPRVRSSAPSTVEVPIAVPAAVEESNTMPVLVDAPSAIVLSDGVVAQALARAEYERASDVLLSSDRTVRLRVGGQLVELDSLVVQADTIARTFLPLLDAPRRAELERRGSVDVSLDLRASGAGRRWRINVFRQFGGLAVALRPVRTDVPSLRELGLPDDLHDLTAHRSGLVLVTGTAGAGKSTTLVALVEHVNRTAAKHIITLEDPIEYEYAHGRALIHQREIGRHVDDFASGLRSALRETPDIIMVGELRDRDAISAALTAAETGHLVLATMSTPSAAKTIDRLIDMFPP
ncbi:MAG TPA: ATPase, T2SS/T4P/T4SS family, partial [Nannocystaceae bacterium]|nr:ATPase, T2SS/T4P/T4SS family [Nannocystaceae bacterium]